MGELLPKYIFLLKFSLKYKRSTGKGLERFFFLFYNGFFPNLSFAADLVKDRSCPYYPAVGIYESLSLPFMEFRESIFK